MENSRRNRNVVMGALTVGALSLLTLQNLGEDNDEPVEEIRRENSVPQAARRRSVAKPKKSRTPLAQVEEWDLPEEAILEHAAHARAVLDTIDMDDEVVCPMQRHNAGLGVWDETTDKLFESDRKFDLDSTGNFSVGREFLRYNDPAAGRQVNMFIYLDGEDCDGERGAERNAYEFPVLVVVREVDLKTGKEVEGRARRLCLETQPEDSDRKPLQGAYRAYDAQLEKWGIDYSKDINHPKVQDACYPGREEGATSIFLNGENVGIVEAHEQGKDADGMTSVTMPNGTRVRYNPDFVTGVSLETPKSSSEVKE